MSHSAANLAQSQSRGICASLQRRLESALYHRRGLVRKSSAFLLRAPKRWNRLWARQEDYLAQPPVLSNSFPKSGTHLLDQIVAGLPDRTNYGAFLASLTSSFQMRMRSDASALRYIRATTPGENVRAHLFFKPEYADALREFNFVHYFIYRDPRDVIVSSCHYLRGINPWHRWRKYFKQCATLEDAIKLSIRGVRDSSGSVVIPNVAERFAPYEGWITNPDVCAIRFEDLRGAGLDAGLERMLAYYSAHRQTPVDQTRALDSIRKAIAPEKSHTFRKGGAGGWRDAFTEECKDAFKEVAGDLLVRLGYEKDLNW